MGSKKCPQRRGNRPTAISTEVDASAANKWGILLASLVRKLVSGPSIWLNAFFRPQTLARDQLVADESTRRANIIINEAQLFLRQSDKFIKIIRAYQNELWRFWDNLNTNKKKGPEAAMAIILGKFGGVEARTAGGSFFIMNDQIPIGGCATPLLLAVYAGRLDVVNSLISHGADVCVRNSDGYTPLHAGAKLGSSSTRMLQVLIDNITPIWIDAKDEAGETPLHVAVEHRKPAAAKCLLDEGASVNSASNKGNTPLHRAASWDSIQAARLLLDCGADPEVYNSIRWTPLKEAVGSTYYQLLAEISLKDSDAAELNAFWFEHTCDTDE